MSAKLRFCAAALALAVSGCGPEPLEPEQAARIERIYQEMPVEDRQGVIRNLRFAGVYSGPLNTAWKPAFADAINEVHWELDFLEDQWNLSTDAGTSSFLDALANTRIRQRIESEVTSFDPTFKQVSASSMVAERRGRSCVVDGGTYERHGETLHLEFFRNAGLGGISISWDGATNADVPMLMSVKFGDTAIPLNRGADSQDRGPMNTDFVTTNGFWVTDGMRHSDRIVINLDEDLGPIELPTGELYQGAKSLSGCADNANKARSD